jgi:hypothetical protein
MHCLRTHYAASHANAERRRLPRVRVVVSNVQESCSPPPSRLHVALLVVQTRHAPATSHRASRPESSLVRPAQGAPSLPVATIPQSGSAGLQHSAPADGVHRRALSSRTQTPHSTATPVVPQRTGSTGQSRDCDWVLLRARQCSSAPCRATLAQLLKIAAAITKAYANSIAA